MICEGVIFYDGKLVIVEDVVYLYNCIMDFVNKFLFVMFIDFVESVKVVDDKIVEFKFKYLFVLFVKCLIIVKIVLKYVIEVVG